MTADLPFFLTLPRGPYSDVRVKAQPEDFVVEELPLYPPVGTGSHTWFWIEKRGLNTHDAARRLALALGKRAQDAGWAGLKDAQAVTRQWLSFEHVTEAQVAALDLGPQLQVLSVTRHGNKLKMGHLRGNRFVIRLRVESSTLENGKLKTTSAALAQYAHAAFESLLRLGVPNYYGTQRFGRAASNLELGRLLVCGDVPAFTEASKAAGTPEARSRDKRYRNLMVNAFQSDLFNQVLALRMPHLGTLCVGDLAQLHRNGAVFKIADASLEQPRCDALEVSPSGPLFGPKMPSPEGVPGEMEQAVLAASGVAQADFGRKEAERQPGARRPLRVPLLEAPEVLADQDSVLLKFALPSGSYATVVLRELLGDEPLALH